MMVGLTAAATVLVIVLFAVGWSRIRIPRKSGLEGIENAEAALAYDRISRWPQFRLLRRMIVRKLSQFGPSGTLADIGCGPGLLTLLIAQAHPHLQVLGIDTAEEMVRAATENAASLGLSDRVGFRHGDVGSLPLTEGSIDFALTTLSLHHWADPGRGLDEIHRVLKSGGQLLLFDFRRDPRRFFSWLLTFAQTLIVPKALRRVNEPLGSLLSSYSHDEIVGLFDRSPFSEWHLMGGAAWVFAWGRKDLADTT